jgi:DNA-binding PadR family transcriptional regulator
MSLKHAILGFLSISPLTGYDLKKAFDQSVRHFWPANQSQIYRTLAELDDDGLVTKDVIAREDRLDMKVYHLSEAGLAELRRWLAAPLPSQDTREPLLIQVFFAGQITDAELLGVLQHQRAEAEAVLAALTAIYHQQAAVLSTAGSPRSAFFSSLTLEYGLAAYAALRRWLLAAIRRIENHDYSPASLPDLIGEQP